MAIGKFHGVMMPTTPTGSRVSSTSMPGARRGQFFARESQRLAGEEIEDLRGAQHLADRLGQRLALLARQELSELVLARDDLVRDLLQNVVALLDARARPGAGKGGACRGDRLLGLLTRGARITADDVAGIGGIDVVGGLGSVDPASGDEILMQSHDELLLRPWFWHWLGGPEARQSQAEYTRWPAVGR